MRADRMRLPLLLAATVTLACFTRVTADGDPLPPNKSAGQDARLRWAFAPPKPQAIPNVKRAIWARNRIDYYILAKLEAQGLSPSAEADKLALLRRVTYDLTGLPPTIEEQEAFLRDSATNAYEKVVDRLLASPRYGERYAQHWLDLVRYAETDGFREDAHRPHAHRYRDWVIKALNDNMPYDRFVKLQLAGDELEPNSLDALVATGYLRLYPTEWNAANLEQHWQESLDDITEVTSLAFLGLTFGCAKCHDHKYDPTLQSDYFRFQAFFSALVTRDDHIAADAAAKEAHARRVAEWEAKTKDLRSEMEAMVGAKRTEMRSYTLERFRQEIQDAVKTPVDKRTPYQEQIARLAEKQLTRSEREAPTKMSAEVRKKYQALEKQLEGTKPPAPLPTIMAVSDIGSKAPPTHLLANGDWRRPREELTPGVPDFLPRAKLDYAVAMGVSSTGRRAALARWLTQPDHPLTTRVMVNRLWQHHFGVGIIASANDFGKQGDAPTHPELLDWLAIEFVRSGWDLKHMHRLMVTSATYRQSAIHDPANPAHAAAAKSDPDNKLLWRARRWRLEGEAMRDAMLRVSGDLNERMYGASARPKLPANISKAAWSADAKMEDQNRRSVYVMAKRNLRFPLFDAFDQPDMFLSCSRRLPTVTAPQALYLLNGEFTRERAQAWAGKLLGKHGQNLDALVAAAFREAYGRPPQADEVRTVKAFLAKQSELIRERGVKAEELVLPVGGVRGVEPARAAAIVDFCHALFNTNEFLYVD
jgi:hypothetical protein